MWSLGKVSLTKKIRKEEEVVIVSGPIRIEIKTGEERGDYFLVTDSSRDRSYLNNSYLKRNLNALKDLRDAAAKAVEYLENGE